MKLLFLTPISLKLYKVVLLSIGWLGFGIFAVMAGLAQQKADQYQTLNLFLETKMKALNGERTLLEKTFQEAISEGLNTNNTIEKAYETDKKNAIIWIDSNDSTTNKSIFEKRYGKLRQYEK